MRIGIIGHFGGNENYNDGQTVKVKSLYTGLKNELPNTIKVDKVDTYYLKKNKLKLISAFLKCLLFDKKIIFLPATNGRKILFPLMHYIRIIFNKEIYHDCIGGALVKEIAINPKWKKYLNGFKINWMESEIQVTNLKKNGIKNAEYLPNFKNINPLPESKLKMEFDMPIRFCTFSRVLPMKGIEDAAFAVAHANKHFGEKKAILDIYGPIQSGYEEWFEHLMIKYGGNINYCGNIDPLKSVEVLKDYFALLFPTRYFTEGMPGTIIDAFFSGVPVISRKWAYCDQLICNDYNGISYSFDDSKLLNSIIIECIDNPNHIIKMRNNCLLSSKKYTEKYVMKQIIDLIFER